MKYTKPYLPVSNQIRLLADRGMDVGDAALAERVLVQIGYYRLSAYWYPFRRIEGHARTDNFRDGAKLQDAVSLYIFDKKLRLHVLDAIERIEIGLRTAIALQIGKFGAWAHRDVTYVHGKFSRRTNRHGNTHFREWMNHLDRCEERSRDEFVLHYRGKYTSERFLPLWISVEVWELGLLSHFLAGIRHADMSTVGLAHGLTDPHLLPSWTRTLTFVRNVCAHHGRLWNRAMVDQPRFPRTGDMPDFEHVALHRPAQERLYGTLVILAYLVKRLNPDTAWPTRVKTLLESFPQTALVDLSSAGFPENWKDAAVWN
tara:strand:- start:9297 stop:10241 length:945 start_codon:yes stop_codon:yes gene_type:complete